MGYHLITSFALVWVITTADCGMRYPEHLRVDRDSTPSAPPLRIMIFNLRLDLASDGPNAWPYRRDWGTDGWPRGW